MEPLGLGQVEQWFERRGWTPFDFQREVWDAVRAGESGLLHSATGTGKTLAVWMGFLMARRAGRERLIWVTPMRALAGDTARALMEVDCAGRLDVGLRTGDVGAAVKKQQLRKVPDALVTTPESLCVMLSQPGAEVALRGLVGVVVDEWHELLGTKRGVQVELALARLRRWNEGLVVWGLSATLGNTAEAASVLVGEGGRLVCGSLGKELRIETLLPGPEAKFPWAGHLGLALAKGVAEEIAKGGTSLIFTNTRSQAELWYGGLAELLPEGTVGLHHASMERALREEAEEGLRTGRLLAVVATSSLDLGVDFAPVDRVFQVGSPRGVARLLQRAGRSGHAPGRASRVICVPANTFELVEIAAARDLAQAGVIEARRPLECPMDVLAQHVLTVAAAGGFRREDLLGEVRTTYAYRNLSDGLWDWVLEFAATGGPALRASGEFCRLVRRDDGLMVFRNEGLARRHRMVIGTIASDSAVEICLANGRKLGEVEEAFVSRLRKGDVFQFAGRRLALVNLRGMRATVRLARGRVGAVPQWMGGKMPLSSELAEGVRRKLDEASRGKMEGEEMERMVGILEIQRRLSVVPAWDELLMEWVQTREGWHIFLFPFEGRAVHEGLAALIGWRLAQVKPTTFTFAVNDYGIEWLSSVPVDVELFEGGEIFSMEGLAEDVRACLNATEMARRQFRQIARVAGLTFEGFPGRRKPTRHLQVSSGLLFDVFRKYDPGNVLVEQSEREVLETQIAASRLGRALEGMRGRRLVVRRTEVIGPFAYPLFVERLRSQLSTEELAQRLAELELPYERPSEGVQFRSGPVRTSRGGLAGRRRRPVG